MKYTAKYGFIKPEATDTVNANDINENFDMLDQKLKETKDQNADFNATSQQLLIDAGNSNAEKKVDLVLFMGQSNMAGRGTASKSPVVPYGHGYEFRAISDPHRLYNITEPFGVNENNPASGVAESIKTGSLVSAFANAYYAISKIPIVGVSCSKGGTKIDWWQPDGLPLQDAIARYNLARNWLEFNGFTVRRKFMVWCQGESDGDAKTSKETYTALFNNMLNAMLEQGIEKLFLIRIGNYNGADSPARYSDIIECQTTIAQTNPNVVMCACNLAGMRERNLMKDEFHYTQEGYNECGQCAGENVAVYYATGKEPAMYDSAYNTMYYSHKN